MKMHWGKWYVVELSFKPSNPIHHAICKSYGTESVVLYGNSDNPISINIKKLHHFKVLYPIKEMNEIYPLRMKE